MIPMLAMSPQKQAYIRQDQADWVRHWNAINSQERGPEKPIQLRFPDIFPIRSPVLLRIAMVEPKTTPVLCAFPSNQYLHLRTFPPADPPLTNPVRACWEQNIDVSNAETLASHLSASGFNSADLLKRASSQQLKDQLRANTDQALKLGLCGAPTYRVLEKTNEEGWVVNGGLVWGQDELGVVHDLVAGWREEGSMTVADVSTTHQLGGINVGPALKAEEEAEGTAPAKPML